MLSPSSFAIAFVLAAGLFAAGVYFVRRPEAACRRFVLGQVDTRFGVRFFRGVGWFYVCGGLLGMLMVIAAAIVNFSHLHGR
jgi:hypothetical protein